MSNKSCLPTLNKLSWERSWILAKWVKSLVTVWRELWSLVSCWCSWSCHKLVTTMKIIQALQVLENSFNLEEVHATVTDQLIKLFVPKVLGYRKQVGKRRLGNLLWRREILTIQKLKKKFYGSTLLIGKRTGWLNQSWIFQINTIKTNLCGFKMTTVQEPLFLISHAN